MRRLISLYLLFLSTTLFAHEVRLTNQHLKLNRQHQSAWQSDIRAEASLSEKLQAGLTGTYLERFDLYEKRVGVFGRYSPVEKLTLEAHYMMGQDNVEILPHDFYQLSLYQAMTIGITPFLSYLNRLYSVTHVQTVSAGVEIEKIRSVILIPQIMLGQARFDNAAKIEKIYNLGLKAIYYQENNFSLIIFGYKGTEASQGIVGQSNIIFNTLTGGAGVAYYLQPNIMAEFLFDYTDYNEINNQFLTSTLNLVWKF
jgi:hypothetical protein